MAQGYRYAQQTGRQWLAGEQGTIRKEAPRRVALVYPSPYRAAMSSLGYQSIYGRLNRLPGVAADRAVLPDDVAEFRRRGAPLLTLERDEPVGNYPVIAFSVAYELEIGGVIDCLELAGLPPLARERTGRRPLVVAGGPLTFSNPAPLAPFCDLILLGEGEELVAELDDAVAGSDGDPEAIARALAGRPGFYVAQVHGDRVPPVAQANDCLLPARSQIITANTELSSMFLTEAVRGCSRGCTYCVMRRSTNGGMRVVPTDEILAGIPAHARRVGLVGASVTDHPRIVPLLRTIVDSGREIGISSLRADRLSDELVGLLRRGGYRTLTVAMDGASERLRAFIERRHTEQHLVRAAELARAHRLEILKIYLMVGLPGETDADIDELVRFTGELARIHHRISFGVAPFVAKRNTPLDGEPFAGVKVVEQRLRRLRRGLRGTAELRPTSTRWAWVEYMLAQGGASAGLALYDAHRAGGRIADYKRSFAIHDCQPTGPVARVPSTRELLQLRRRASA
jgi:radical SAM superfamily enzyme YgiQ (UPF0313 family)